MFRKWRLTVEDSKSIQFVCSSDDKEENVNQDKAPSRENSQDFNQDPVEVRLTRGRKHSRQVDRNLQCSQVPMESSFASDSLSRTTTR